MKTEEQNKIGEVIGIGVIAFIISRPKKPGESIFLPQMHFVLFRSVKPSGRLAITGICIELSRVYSEESDIPSEEVQEKVLSGLVHSCTVYLENIANGKKTDELKESLLELLKGNYAEELWEAYRLENFKASLEHGINPDSIKQNALIALAERNAVLEEENKILKEQASDSIEETQVMIKNLIESQEGIQQRVTAVKALRRPLHHPAIA